jgi:hypothetical protein
MKRPRQLSFSFSVLIVFLISGLIQCKKSQRFFLPPVTEQGKNTFGCLVNGQIWVPFYSCHTWNGRPQIVYIIQSLDSFSILPLSFDLQASNSVDGGSSWSFVRGFRQADHLFGVGNIVDSLDITYWSTNGEPYLNTIFFPSSSAPRYMQITKLDTVNKIVSGIFSFTLYGGAPNTNFFDSAVVTKGVFDLQIGSWLTCTE